MGNFKALTLIFLPACVGVRDRETPEKSFVAA